MSTVGESPSISPTNRPGQRQITVQRIGRDATPLLPSQVARYQQMLCRNRAMENTRSADGAVIQNLTENNRLRSLAQRIPRLNPIVANSVQDLGSSSSSSSGSGSEFRPIPWSEVPQMNPERNQVVTNEPNQNLFLGLPLEMARMNRRRVVLQNLNAEILAYNSRNREQNSDLEFN